MIYAYRRSLDPSKPFHVFNIALEEGQTEYSFFDDFKPADDAKDMVEDATSVTGTGSVLFLITKGN